MPAFAVLTHMHGSVPGALRFPLPFWHKEAPKAALPCSLLASPAFCTSGVLTWMAAGQAGLGCRGGALPLLQKESSTSARGVYCTWTLALCYYSCLLCTTSLVLLVLWLRKCPWQAPQQARSPPARWAPRVLSGVFHGLLPPL